MPGSLVNPEGGPVQIALEKAMRGLGSAAQGPSRWWRRWRRRPQPVADGSGLLPTLIKVFAAFTNIDGSVMEEEIDSSLGFLRYDYPDAVYSELRKLFRQALHEHQDLDAIARKLSAELSEERKLLLGVQLYDLISRAGLKSDQIVAYYSFMTNLGMAAQAVDIVYQLNSDEQQASPVYVEGISPLEVISLGSAGEADVTLRGLAPGERLLAYRYHDLLLVKNRTQRNFMVQGRLLKPGDLGRIYAHQRILYDDQVITHQDLFFYFNAKKNVSQAHVFLALNANEEVQLARTRERDSCLEIVFGLEIKVIALRDVDATLRDIPLKAGTEVDATLEDKIIFFHRSELPLEELRRRARTFGRRFALKPSKSEYLVSNQPSLLQADDILLTPGIGGDVLLKIECDYDRKVGKVTVLKADRPIVVRGTPVRNSAVLQDGDTIRIDTHQLLRCNFTDRLIEEERNIIRSLEVRDVVCRFRDGENALEAISFSARRGEMICVMGASGSGKSTLLRALSGQFRPVQGEVLFNQRSLYDHFEELKQYVAYVPQFDAFDEHLTIEENLEYAAAIRSPHLSQRERLRRIDARLAELGLNERRRNVVGTPHKKTLSGGERKRLNIGLDMIGVADIYLFDEPTSGLSSKDSEHIIEIIRALAHNKIVLVTIHQPSSKIFALFHKVILLDKGGKLVFFGTTEEALKYFAEAEHQEQFGTNLGACPACGSSRPEFIFDVLETPLRDFGGDIIYEENNRGQLMPARRFSPDYWRDRYEAWRLTKEVRSGTPVTRDHEPTAPGTGPLGTPRSRTAKRHDPWRWREEVFQFRTLLARAFTSKLRNEANLLITLIMAPLLALLIGGVLRYSEAPVYDFASAFHIPAYLFLSIVVAMFLGLTNSVDDIIRDRPVLVRERNLNVRISYYILAKVFSLAAFAAVQCLLFTLIGNWILEVRGFTWPMFFFLFLTSLSGISIGLLISSVVMESKTAVLLIPAVFIPQIILGGSFIKYEEMNRNLDLAYAFQSWFDRHPDSAMEPQSDLVVPLICEFNPMRWSYEAIVFAQARLNPLTARQRQIQREIRSLVEVRDLSPEQEERLEDLKELLAVLSGLEGESPQQVDLRMGEIDRILQGGPLDRSLLMGGAGGVTAEQLYVNQKVVDLVSKAEMEQADYREERHLNVFFGPTKEYFGLRAGLLTVNSIVLLSSSLLILVVLYFILRRQLRGQQF
jgi:ABC-type multidrug transport system ATPase subunit/ABC-type multidrug transport system permease subunit